ncbi:Gfo/Idh/MocA family protein [Macrococcoides caseolyticum]|uniref:Gfo/Idh/MocA family protein n=1 Tax=Macrococcoides caseolyticum TaxID=69966 RepID=UPI001F165017|nr:Gfo/Idh/MocA family oxidoreductase [Macrococcus caseolyticus]MCE4957451.1 Gfo/Idh/MocA family oxidoreductase [Macrococcus caseolyticus]
MKFGFIGTNWITDRLIEAGRTVPEFELHYVYSRTLERAQSFAEKHHIPNYTDDLDVFLNDDALEIIYIATPNILHHQQAIQAMNHGKHVLCEKPIATSEKNFNLMVQAMQNNNVFFMEAMKSIYSPSFQKLHEWIHEIGMIRRVNFHYNQYSSRYDKYKEGIIENAFKPELGNGALMDLGVYTISPLVHLFGMPKTIQATGKLLSTGADGQGTIICNHHHMTSVLSYSKIIDSHLPSEIIGEEGIILVDKISAPNKVQKLNRHGEVIDEIISNEPPMAYEIKHFIETIKSRNISALNLETSHHTMKVIDEVKKQIGILIK